MPSRAARSTDPEAEWFGFRRVRPEDKAGLVRDVFASVASRYDLMNDLMSGGLHRLWKDMLVRRMRPRPGQRLLDVAGGTGDIALRCHARIRAAGGEPSTTPAQSRLRPGSGSGAGAAQGGRAQITVCDINPAMLERGRARALDRGVLHGIDWITGDAEALPLPDRSVDTYSIAFGLRNVTRIDRALAEAARVLKPGGRFFCLEFSPGVAPLLKPAYDLYCARVLPLLGEFVARDRASYQYLAESILQFPRQAELAARMERAGLARARWTDLTGGIAVIHDGWRL